MHINRYIFIYVQRVCNVINGGGTEYYPIVLWDHPGPPIYRYPRSSPNGNRTKYPQEADLVFSDLHSRPHSYRIYVGKSTLTRRLPPGIPDLCRL